MLTGSKPHVRYRKRIVPNSSLVSGGEKQWVFVLETGSKAEIVSVREILSGRKPLICLKEDIELLLGFRR